ncbi:hypothetical protein GOV12_03725 [Candidatus Pacearchaeota archaeon]|nr:hypothetical protein [Candidatus Pacearchaeota archaeon]
MVLKKIVQGWNYVTGSTQKRLAELTLVVGTAIELGGEITSENPVAYALIPVSLICSGYTLYKWNKNEDYFEESSNKGMLVPKDIGDFDLNRGYHATIGGLSGITWGLLQGFTKGWGALSAGILIRGLSHFINRTESPPPGKNILEKEVDGSMNISNGNVPIPVEPEKRVVPREYFRR